MSRATFLRLVVPVVGANDAAQVPYYLRQYYIAHHAPPSRPGTNLLAATLAWFVLGVAGLRRGSGRGYWLLVAFLAVEFLFYRFRWGLLRWMKSVRYAPCHPLGIRLPDGFHVGPRA